MKPLLERIGSSVLHMGPTGSGQLTKTLNNVLYDINIAALAEVPADGGRHGARPATMAEVVTTGTSRSYASQIFVPQILEGRFDVGYPMGSAYKDLVAAAGVAMARGFPMPVTAAATATYQNALLQGHGARTRARWCCRSRRALGVAFRRP